MPLWQLDKAQAASTTHSHFISLHFLSPPPRSASLENT